MVPCTVASPTAPAAPLTISVGILAGSILTASVTAEIAGGKSSCGPGWGLCDLLLCVVLSYQLGNEREGLGGLVIVFNSSLASAKLCLTSP